ncbi:hypothetical protein TNCV_1825891 [Trichonephila clavipes]|nr:hypothetical protein TNCV_1825891 [Trichonephila clavipes]
MNQIYFQYVEAWSETNITENKSFQWCFLTSSQIKRANKENYVDEMPDIKIDYNGLYEEKLLNAYLNSNKLEQLENQHAEIPRRRCSQLASLDKNNVLLEIKLRLPYLQGKSTTMSVIAHQTEKEWISANEKSRQRMSQTQAEGAAKQHAARFEDAHL